MAYVVLARKYRPRTFKDFIGQEAISTTLANSIETDRVAHAYLFCGPRGVGKTSMARVFAKALNCAKGPTTKPCNKCEMCLTIATGNDVDVIEIDGASNRGIDEVREIRQNVKYSPNRSRFKIYIIDEVHMLTEPAFNALLKTLEEPPAHVKFILATTAPAKLPETIHSRLQRFTFRRVDIKTLAAHLKKLCKKEDAPVDSDVLNLVSRQARGSVRDALSMLDQTLAFCGEHLTLERAASCLGALSDDDLWKIIDAMAEGDAPTVLTTADDFLQRGVGIGDLIQQLTSLARDLMVAKHCGADADLLGRTSDGATAVAARSERFESDALMYAVQILSEASRRVKDEVDARIVLEMALIKLCRHEDMTSLQQLLDRLAEMEKRLTQAPAGTVPRPQPRPGPATESGPLKPPPSPPPSTASPPSLGEAPPDTLHTPQVPEGQPAPADVAGTSAWDKALEWIRQKDMWAYMQVSHASLLKLENGKAVIEFPHHMAAQRSECESRSARETIESAFETIVGRRVHVRFELATQAETETVVQDAIKHDPLVRAALEIFDGRILMIQKPDAHGETQAE